MSETPFPSVRELGTLLRLRKISAVELAKESLAKLDSVGGALGAVVTVTHERALKEAQAADAELARGQDRGPLHGIPYGVKDLLATAGIPTTWGAEPFRDQVFDHDATVVEKISRAGGVLVAKLAMVELAGGLGYNNPDASFTGPGRNPWNRDHWSGGSSSGSGAATAAGLVPYALGSETSGSILTPAAFCGVTGLRPTYGLVSRHGAMALCWTLDKIGPLARSADDCGLVLSAIAGPDPKDPTSAGSFSYATPPPSRRFKLGVLKGCAARAEPEVRHNFEAAVAVLRTFSDVEEDVVFPDLPFDAAVEVIVAAEGAAAFRGLIEGGGTKKLRDVSDRLGGYAMMMTLAVDYLDALRARVSMRAALSELLSRYDALVAPTRGRVAPWIGYDFDKPPEGVPSPDPSLPRPPSTIAAGNLAGLPALALPTGFGRYSLPTSIQLLGGSFSEATLLAVGKAYQSATDWHRRRPPAAEKPA